MDFLLHNPLAEMIGPQFLLLYASVIVITLTVCAAHTYRDNRDPAILPPIPVHPDPYEIAYLRGGENEVLRLAIFNLLRGGYVQIERGKLKRQQATRLPHPANRLNPIEQEALAYFDQPRAPESIFTSSLPSQVKQLCASYQEQLYGDGLLSPIAAWQHNVRIGLQGALVIGGLGGYKLMAAVNNGHHNIGFLIGMMLIALCLLAFVCRTPRLSSAGQRYLGRMQVAYAGIKPAPVGKGRQAGPGTTRIGQDAATLPLALAVFGVGALAATEYATFHQMFQRAASAGGGGGCGGGGSGCGGGGGCGGGCGGCGGG